VRALAGEIDGERDTAGKIGLLDVDQPLLRMQRVELLRIEDGFAGAEAHLRQPRALAQQHRKRLRRDLRIKRTMIAGADHVEAAPIMPEPGVPSAMTRVKPSRRPVELFGFAAATISFGRLRLSRSGTM